MNTRILLFLTLSTLSGCIDVSDSESDVAYFGGEIINPNNNYVVLSSPNDISDTLYLDDNNRFTKKLTLVKAGLYTFTHGGEYQRVLLEPNDSIMLRLNTIDFDESLVFTGEGARKNNYLMACFVDNEAENKKLMQMMWDMEPVKFEEILDADRNEKLEELNKLLSYNEYTDLFKSIAETNINYNYYYNKELYPFGYYGYNNLIHYKDLPENFYNFRNDVDYNNVDLVGVIPYYRFLFYHFNNLALAKYYQTATHNVVFDNKSVVYNLEKLRLMDSLVSNDHIKNHLLKYTARDFIAVSVDSAETNEVLASYFEKSTSEKDKEYIKKLANSVSKLKSGNQLPDITLLAYDGSEVDMKTIISKPTLFYFWSSNLPLLMRNSHYKVKTLEVKFPEVNFIGININDEDETHWKKTLSQYKLEEAKEYHFLKASEAMDQLAINSVNRSILVHQDGTIINANAMLFTSEFEEELEYVVHKKKAHQEQ